MDFIENILNLFKTDKHKAFEEVLKQRYEAKSKLAEQLKSKCYMNEQDISQVMQIVDEFLDRLDKFQNEYDFGDNDFVKMQKFDVKIKEMRKEFIENLKAKVKFIMDVKLAIAKEYFKDKPNPENSKEEN